MTRVPVATSLHILAELIGEDAEPFQNAPHFVIASDVLEIMTREDVQRSIAAMLEAQIAHLPYPKLLVEFAIEPSVRRFILLREEGSLFRAQVASLHRGVMASLSPGQPAIEVLPDRLDVSGYSGTTEGQALALAAAIALLMLNTRGIDKIIVEPTRLNAKRKAAGKEPIPKHSIVRIGTIYDRKGRAISGEARRHMPVHLRAGHTRMQAYGPEYSQHRPVYIYPVLVNYREGAEAPTPKRVVKV